MEVRRSPKGRGSAGGSRVRALLVLVTLVPAILVPAILAPAGCSGPEPPGKEGGLPRVLIIGDSISIGYTPHVTEALAGRAVVVHNPGNAQHTATGLKELDGWLGDGRWDVIHFNWGLWDLCYKRSRFLRGSVRDREKGTVLVDLDRYEANLAELTARLQKTGATLIWATTTVVPEGDAGRFPGDDLRYNEAAARVMRAAGVTVNDLNAASREFPPELFVQPGDVHFTDEGYRRLANHVSAAISEVLP